MIEAIKKRQKRYPIYSKEYKLYDQRKEYLKSLV